MKAIRSRLDRLLSGSPQRKPFSIIRDKAFKPANEALLRERATKNHPGGVSDNEDESQSVIMAWLGNPRCPVACLEKYLAKRDPRCDALWQKPKNHNASFFHSADEVWFCNVPTGKHRLENLLTEMCKTAGLAHIYTPHCIRATSVTVLKAADLENRRVESVTGHASDKSMESCSARPTIGQQFESSAIVSRFLRAQLYGLGYPKQPFP